MPKAVGIDLGTTNSVVAVMEGDEPTVIVNREGDRTTPSVVAFEVDGNLLVGRVAKNQAAINPERTVLSVKREMGTAWSIDIDGREYRSQEIAARVLQKLKQDAEDHLRDSVTEAVITVPAYFDDAQRTATVEAGRIAGLEVLRIINEPTAAALAYGLDENHDNQTILVFDLGGGTFDVSILDINDGLFQVRSTSGDSHLGGDDWDNAVVDWLVESFESDHGVNLSDNAETRFRLKEAAEQAKKDLSSKHTTQVNLPFVTATADGPLHLDYELTRAKFEDLTFPLLNRCRGPFERAISDAEIDTNDIDHVILVGGSTRMPAVKELVVELSGREAHEGVNPDEVVACGAAVQAGVLKGDVTGIVLVDVTPLSLGTAVVGDRMSVIIKRNTTIPTRRTETFVTVYDDQEAIRCTVLQGEREIASANKLLGEFVLGGIPPAPRGVPQIDVSFEIDADGLLHVSAKDTGTGNVRSLTVRGHSRLSDAEIDRMIADAEAHAEADQAWREQAEIRNEAEALVYRTERMLEEQEGQHGTYVTQPINEALAVAKAALAGSDTDEIVSAAEHLRAEARRFGEAIYQGPFPDGSMN